jgi:hypothetical protein
VRSICVEAVTNWDYFPAWQRPGRQMLAITRCTSAAASFGLIPIAANLSAGRATPRQAPFIAKLDLRQYAAHSDMCKRQNYFSAMRSNTSATAVGRERSGE